MRTIFVFVAWDRYTADPRDNFVLVPPVTELVCQFRLDTKSGEVGARGKGVECAPRGQGLAQEGREASRELQSIVIV